MLKGCTTEGYRKDNKKTISNKAEHHSNLFTSSITITISFILMETAIVITTGCSTEYPTQRGGKILTNLRYMRMELQGLS